MTYEYPDHALFGFETMTDLDFFSGCIGGIKPIFAEWPERTKYET